MHRETLQPRDLVRLALLVVAERTGALTLELDDHAPEALRLALGALDLLQHRRRLARAPRPEERIDVVVAIEGDEEVDVVGSRAAERDHAVDRSGARRRRRTSRTVP